MESFKYSIVVLLMMHIFSIETFILKIKPSVTESKAPKLMVLAKLQRDRPLMCLLHDVRRHHSSLLFCYF